MGAKEEITRLEQKVDILYNMVLYLEKINNSGKLHSALTHMEYEVFGLVDVEKMSDTEIFMLGK